MTDQSSPAPHHGKNAFMFVIVAVALNMLSFGLIMPIMPALLEDITGLPGELSVGYSGWLSVTFALANFLAMPFLGALSDRYGRRPVLLASIGMLAVDMVIMGLAPTLAVLFVARALSGLFSATYSVANAYIADVTDPADRGRAFGMTGAAFGFGFIFGPVIGGILGDIHTRLPFFAAAAVAGINFLYGYFILPESLAKEDRRTLDWRRANPFGAMRHFAKLPHIAWFIIAIGFYNIAHAVYPQTWSFHGEIRYDWSEFEIGLSLGLVGIGSAVSQALLTGYLIKRLGPMRAAFFGLSVNAFALLLFAFASAPWMAYAIIIISAIGGVAMPAINTVTSSLTPRNAQGELQGAQSSIMALTLIFSPILMTQTLQYFSSGDAPVYFPGAAFLLAAIITAVSLIPFAIGIAINRRALAGADTTKKAEA